MMGEVVTVERVRSPPCKEKTSNKGHSVLDVAQHAEPAV
jgi:hypothetical protein